VEKTELTFSNVKESLCKEKKITFLSEVAKSKDIKEKAFAS